MRAKAMSGDRAAGEYLERLAQWRDKELSGKGLKELVLSDPETFLKFFQESATGGYLEGFLEITINGIRTNRLVTVYTDDPDGGFLQKFSKLPKSLTDGLLDMLRSGTSDQKSEILRFSSWVDGLSDEFRDACRALMADPDEEIQGIAIRVHVSRGSEFLTEADAALFLQLARESGKPLVAGPAIRALAAMHPPGYEECLFGIAASTSNRELAHEALYVLSQECAIPDRRRDDAFKRRVIDATSQEIARGLDRPSFRSAIVLLLEHFPPRDFLHAIDKAVAYAPSLEWSEAVKAVAAAIRSGTVNDLKRLIPRE